MPGIRVTGGSLRGRRIQLPRGVAVRPTSDRARQAYFNIVSSRVAGARFLDLFAGTGIFSIEAISRGAEQAIAIDESHKGAAAIAGIAKEWDLPLDARAGTLPAALGAVAADPPFDLVYADPPYDAQLDASTLRAIDAKVPLADGAIVAIEHRAGPTELGRLELSRLRFTRDVRYGNVAIAFFDLAGE
ncbi:MAG: RsmD family RNA methyltransferase [Thermoanaerobaculia bacterium]|nr:RsmD family RNA methyltransferase [Thermoanaerobaculia bacterium]